MEFVLGTLTEHLVGNLSTVRMNVSVGMQTRGYIVRMVAHLLHDVNLAVGRPRAEIHGHHPEGRPRALALRQLDARLDIAILPALLHLGIDAAGMDLTVLLQGGDAELAATHLRDEPALGRLVVDVVLQFVVHPTAALHLMGPVVRVQFRTLVELILPDE